MPVSSGGSGGGSGGAPRQRFVATVPTPATVFVLGSRHWNNEGYAGITGVTAGHVLLKGTAQTSTVTIETPNQFVVHSTSETLTASASQDVLVGSEDKVVVAGNNRVFIASGPATPQVPGIGVFTEPKPATSDPDLMTAGAVMSVIGTMTDIKRSVIMAASIYSAAGFLLGKTATMAGLVVGSVQLAIKASQMTLTPDYDGEVHMHGAGALVVTSMEESLIFGVKAITVVTPMMAGMTAGMLASLSSLLAAGVVGGYNAQVASFGNTEVLGGNKAQFVSRFGDVGVSGKRIALGAAKPAWPQAATEVVEARATSALDLGAGPAGPAKATVRADEEGVTLTGKTLTLAAESATNIAAGTFGARVGTDGVALTRSLESTAKRLTDAANATYQATKTAADTAFDNAVAAAGSTQGVALPLPAILAAFELYTAQVKAAKKALDAQLKAAAKAAAAVLRAAVTNRDAHLTNGLSKISVDSTGKITIDGTTQPIVFKSGASSVEVGPGGITLKSPLIVKS